MGGFWHGAHENACWPCLLEPTHARIRPEMTHLLPDSPLNVVQDLHVSAVMTPRVGLPAGGLRHQPRHRRFRHRGNTHGTQNRYTSPPLPTKSDRATAPKQLHPAK
jgi:hypothetical protein